METVWIGLASAIGGGILVKLADIFFLSKTKQADIATIIRDELRGDIAGYRSEVANLRKEVDYWRRNYFLIIELLLKNDVDIPDHLFEAYRNDPSTPDTPLK